MNSAEAETASLHLLRDLQAELSTALNGLGGQKADGLVEQYLFFSVVHIHRAVEGYIFLRESGRIEASKFLVRTALEAIIRVQAVRLKPELLFRIAFTDSEEHKTWMRRLSPPDTGETLQACEDKWKEFRQVYRSKYPDHPLTEEKLNLFDAADSAGLARYYNIYYRLYCRFTHAALSAITGDFNEFETEDNRTMSLCAFAAVAFLASIDAPAPNMLELERRLRSK
jgi:hypothetical protein